MPTVKFLASLINTGLTPPGPALVLSADSKSVSIVDESNYSATTTTGYTPAAKFSLYRKIIITHQNGGVFTMSSIAGADQLITPASSLSNAFVYTKGFGDGVYAFNLITVPTWFTGLNYQNSFPPSVDCVYNPTDGKLYKNLVAAHGTNNSNQPDLSPSFWGVITDADLGSQFSVTEKLSILSDANVCYMNKVVAANCTIGDANCDNDLLCKNKNFLDAFKLNCLIDGIVGASNKGDFDLAEQYFSTIASICNNC